MSHQHPRHQLLLGIVLAALGALFLLDNFHFFDMRSVLPFWPLVLVGFGVVKLGQSPKGEGRWFGIALIAVGALLTLRHMGWLHFEIRHLWPVLLILAGLAVIFKSRGVSDAVELQRSGDPTQGARISVAAMLSGNQSRVDAQDFAGGEVNVVMGGAELDLRDASMASVASLKVFVLMGGLEIKVPNDWSVIINGLPVLGGIDDKTVAPPTQGKRLYIDGFVALGGIEVRN